MFDVDVAIIGGGPAGASAALALRKKNHSVALFNVARGEKPTETASPAFRNILHSLNASELLQECEPCLGIVSNWGGTRPQIQPSILNPFGHGWFVHRASFDRGLRQLAKDRGVLCVRESVREIVPNGHEVLLSTG